MVYLQQTYGKNKELFKMSELHVIMRHRERKLFAENFKRLREGNHTNDISPHFMQNSKATDFNAKVHNAFNNMNYKYQSTRYCS